MTALEILHAGGDFSHYAPLPPMLPRVSEEEDLAAMTSAHKAAVVLREYGATKVVLFGSLARKTDFERRSDINLLDGATVSESLRKSIESEVLPL